MNEELRAAFCDDLDNVALELISLFGLQFEKEVPQLSSPLLRWLDFRLRHIDPQPRKLVASTAFPKRLPNSVEIGLRHLEKLIISGGDLNPYQSKSILQFHDISGKRRAKRTDLLWADWGIHHLHITDIPVGNGARFSDRACSDGETWLLFCIVLPEAIGLIDIREHNDEGIFADNHLIRLVKDSWPEYMEQFLLKGMMPTRERITPVELSKLRAHGITAPVILDGKAYLNPGLGVTSASTSTKVSQMARELRNWVANLADVASNPEGQIQRDISAHAVESPRLHFCYTPQGLAIHEATRNVGYTLSSQHDDASHSKSMHNLLFPTWVISKLQNALN